MARWSPISASSVFRSYDDLTGEPSEAQRDGLYWVFYFLGIKMMDYFLCLVDTSSYVFSMLLYI
jgi:hypothetical protein